MKNSTLYVTVALIIVLPSALACWMLLGTPPPGSGPEKTPRALVSREADQEPDPADVEDAPAPAAAVRPAPQPVPRPPSPLPAPSGSPAEKERYLRDPAGTAALISDESQPEEERLKGIDELARAADPRAHEILMMVGDLQSDVAAVAIEALGDCRSPIVEEYLKRKLTDAEPTVAAAAVGAYATHRGEAALPDLMELLTRGRTGPELLSQELGTAIVEAMGALRSPEAEPLLSEELEQYRGRGWTREYASSVMRALAAIGTEGARDALEKFAELMARMAPMHADVPDSQKRYEELAAEARALLEEW